MPGSVKWDMQLYPVFFFVHRTQMAASMSTCLATFFWILFISLLVKSYFKLNPLLVDIGMFTISLLSMLLMFASIMKERCGTSSIGSVASSVVLPWVIMVGGTIALIRNFPGWIQPFSNTFGYMVALVPSLGATQKLVAILSPENSSLLKLITQDPNLLLNQFSTTRFEEIIQKLTQEGVVSGTPEAVDSFKSIVVLKDGIAEFIWYFLVGSVALTTSYNFMMNTVCQKDQITVVPADLEVEEEEEEEELVQF